MTSRTCRTSRLVLAIVAAGALTACASGGEATVALDGELDHIHDLVLDADGELLVAGHRGLFRIEGRDRAVMVGAEQHDLMAMTADDDALLASGHPSLLLERYQVEDRPPFLGLVRSSDGGESWEIVDLLGDADFHALTPTGDGLFAAETAGRIWFLDDATGQWSQRGDVEARDLAVDPTNPDRLLAPDYDGVVWSSTDGAMTWSSLADAPALVEIEWVAADDIVGITSDGDIWVAARPDGPWAEAATLATDEDVETLYVDRNGDWWATVHGGAIFRSSDRGATWKQIYVPPARL